MSKRTLISLFAIGCGAAAFVFRRSARRPRTAGILSRTPAVAANRDVILRRYLMYFMLPLWFVPGLLDYYWHRRTRIETTSGFEESVIHALMMTEVGVPILMCLLLEINAGVILFLLFAYVLHSLTAIWDVSYAVQRRLVKPAEQHTHSFLEMLPFCAVSIAVCLHSDEALALVGMGSNPPEFAFRAKRDPLPGGYIATLLVLIGTFVVVPYSEELLRCWKARQQGLIGRDTPECARELFGETATAATLEQAPAQ